MSIIMTSTAWWRLLFASILSSAVCAKEYNIEWTKQGVEDLGRKLQVRSGDSLRFSCPIGSYSTIWYMVDPKQFENCDCGSDTCLRPAFCPGLIDYSYTVDIVRNSEQLGNAQDYQPGSTYYFASFSNGGFSDLNSDSDSGGECVRDELRLAVEVLPADNTGGGTDSTVSPPTEDPDPSGNTGGEGDKDDEDEKEQSGSGFRAAPDSQPLTPSSSLSFAATLSSIVMCTVLALVMRH